MGSARSPVKGIDLGNELDPCYLALILC
jgi:hypothetical protein